MRFLVLTLCFGCALAGTAPEVKNGMAPKGKSQTLSFKEQLRFGANDSDPNYVWSGEEVSLCVTDNGHMYVADSGGNRILEYDAKGKFVRQIGREGKGPGEFVALKHLSLLADGGAIALDQTQGFSAFSTFDKSWNFVNREVLSSDKATGAKLIRGALLSPNGKFVYASYISGTEYGIALLSRKLKVLYPLKNGATLQFNMEQVNNPQFWVDFLAAWLKVAVKPGLVAFGPNDKVYINQHGDYRITRCDGNLREELVFSKQYKPIPVSPEVLKAFVEPVREAIASSFPAELAGKLNDTTLERAIAKAELPARKDPVFGMIPMEDGRLVVVHDFNPLTRTSVADMFDAGGVFLGSFPLPKPHIIVGGSFLGEPVKMTFKNGLAYVLQRTEDDEFQVVRFSYTTK